MSSTLVDLFVAHVPGVPAMNKWLACYPMLSWMVLGRLCHGVMVRAFSVAILNLPEFEDSQGTRGKDETEEAVAVGRNDSEGAFTTQRKQRATRIRTWLRCELTHLWSTVCLLVTESTSQLVGQYLKDEHMYTPERAVGTVLNPWADHDTRPRCCLSCPMAC